MLTYRSTQARGAGNPRATPEDRRARQPVSSGLTAPRASTPSPDNSTSMVVRARAACATSKVASVGVTRRYLRGRDVGAIAITVIIAS